MQPGSARTTSRAVRPRDGPAQRLRLWSGVWAEIVRRHEILRTTFVTIGDEPVQRIAPDLTIALPIVDLSGYDAAEREAQVQTLARDEARRGFDLIQGPLLRMVLLRLAGDDHVILFTMHHIVSDGWSIEVLVREITAHYTAFCQGRACTLPELPIQYADFASGKRGGCKGKFWKASSLIGEAS